MYVHLWAGWFFHEYGDWLVFFVLRWFVCNILAKHAVTYACTLYCVGSAPWRTWPVRVRTVFREGGFGRRPAFSLAGQMWGRSDQIAGLFLKKTSWPGVRLTTGEREHGNVCWHIVSHQQRRESQQVKTTSEATEHCHPPPPPPKTTSLSKNDGQK